MVSASIKNRANVNLLLARFFPDAKTMPEEAFFCRACVRVTSSEAFYFAAYLWRRFLGYAQNHARPAFYVRRVRDLLPSVTLSGGRRRTGRGRYPE